MNKTVYLLGSGFTKAALPSAPTNAELLSTLIAHSPSTSPLLKYKNQYGTDDIEILLTRLDMDAASDKNKYRDRLTIETELAAYFRNLRFTQESIEEAPWLSTFANELLEQDDAIITLNYDCFLDGLLDYYGVWTPNRGYYGVDNVLVEATPNPRNIVIYKIHGSEHFRVSPPIDRPEQDAIAYEFNRAIFPVSAANSHFGGGIDSRPYVIAPSYVKLPHRQVAMMMLKVLDLVSLARNLVIIGCGLRREDNFLWLLLNRFLIRKDEKRLIVVDPNAPSISSRINQYWIGDVGKYTQICLSPSSLESSLAMLLKTLKDK